LAGIALVALVGLAVAVAPAANSAAPAITIKLVEANESGQHGIAILQPLKKKGRYQVTVKMTKPVKYPGSRQLAHIHNITCEQFEAESGGEVYVVLNATLKQKSVSIIYEALAKVRTGAYSINVHESAAPHTVVACGNIPKP
jgi:hypothetical protein